MKMKILVISDTHGLLRPQVLEMLRKCDAVIHGGDIQSPETLDRIRMAMKPGTPFFIVRGNNDGSWAAHLPVHLEFVLADTRFYLVHNRKDLPRTLGGCQIVIFGHSHQYLEEIKDGRLFLNPGSCGKRRFHQDVTMAVLHLEQGEMSVERIDLEQGTVKAGAAADLPEVSLKVIQRILKSMDKGRTVEWISQETGLDEDFVEEICRIRVTHPGVSANGILDKIEVNGAVQRGARHRRR